MSARETQQQTQRQLNALLLLYVHKLILFAHKDAKLEGFFLNIPFRERLETYCG